MEFKVLGPLEVLDGERSLPLGRGKQRSLLAVLLLHPGEAVATDRLLDVLWGESPPATAPTALQVYISKLRKTLGASRISTRSPGYALELQPEELDLHRFERLAAEGSAALAASKPEDAADLFREALALWRGPILADLAYEGFVQPEARRLEELRVSVLEGRLEADLALGRHAAVVGELEGLAARHPLRERLRGQLMLALYRSGRQADALAAYRFARRALVDELGLEPSAELQELERAILRQDAALAAPETVPLAVAPTTADRREVPPKPLRRRVTASGSDVVGRDEELTAVREFLEVPESLPGAILLEGEAGIGKTTLWRRSLELASAHSYRVLSSRPSGSEVQLSFTGLGDLLEHVLEETLSTLPKPQRRALAVALLLEEADGPPPDHRAVALAFLGAVRALARAGPVAVAVDDVQWLDGPSAFVLEFALRRLRAEPVVFLLALRASDERAPLGLDRALPEDRLRRLTIGPLGPGALRRLLGDRRSLALPRPRLRRLHELSDGNPFFALELARALERGSIRLDAGESLPDTLGALVQERLAVLPAETRAALLAASALSQPTLAVVALAAGGDPEQLLAPALEAHVIELEEDRIRFSHPLLASGVYAAAGLGERRALHRRLAELVPDAEERARHLALGAEGPDPDVSTALEDAALRAHARGALPAAAELSEQARRLTPADQGGDGHRRTIQAAAYAFEAGESGRTRALLEHALDAAPAGLRRAQVLNWLGIVEQYEGDRRVAVDLFQSGLAQAGDDLALRAELEEGLADALFLMRNDLATAADHARAAVALAERVGDQSRQVTALAEQGLIDAVLGRAEWRVVLERAMELEPAAEPVHLLASPSFSLAVNLTWVDELDEARTILRSLRYQAEKRAEESALAWILANLSLVEFLAGRWAEANRCSEEAREIAFQTGQEPQRLFAQGVRALVRASRGNVEGARADAEAALAAAEQRGVMIATILAASALGLLELSLGHLDAVHTILGPLVVRLEEGGVREPGSMRFVPDDIEALIGLGRLEEAEALLRRLERRARELDRTSALAATGRCRGLLSAARGDLDGALASLEQALAEHERVSIPFDHARSLLILGSTQRRAKRKRAARESLEVARGTFSELGARLWVEKADAELARIGGRPSATGDLTPTEGRVAALVAEGRSNKEVAAALFVTVKTVEANLSRIYAKLGLRSRTELARHLAAKRPEGAARKL